MRRADSPMYLSTMADETTLRKLVDSVAATALARSVLPVPGGPYRRTPGGTRERGQSRQRAGAPDDEERRDAPFGGLMPTRMKSSGFINGSSITCRSRGESVGRSACRGREKREGGRGAHLSQLADLVTETTDAAKARARRVLHRHVVHERVDLGRQDAAGRGKEKG